MLIFYFCLFFSVFFMPPAKQIHKVGEKEVDVDYLSPINTLPIKGIFTFLVMCSHSRDYITLSNHFLDHSFNTLTNMIGQLMVAPFFFYSGFGIFESVKMKGRIYIEKFPKRRMLPTWLSFAFCMVLYCIFNLIRKKQYDVKTVLLAFIGWESIGNSNWFMFVTFALYLLFYIIFINVKWRSYKKLCLYSASSLMLFVFLYYTKQMHWCNTLFCMSAGMWFSFFREEIDGFLQDKRRYWITATKAFFLFLFLYYVSFGKRVPLPFSILRPFLFGLCAIIFCLLIVITTMKVQIRSSFCSFLGKHVFSVYILQRIFFISLQPLIANRYMFFASACLLSIIAAILYDALFAEIKKRII